MSRRDLGFLVSRIMAVFGVNWLVVQIVGHLLPTVLRLSNKYDIRQYGDSIYLQIAVHTLATAALAVLIINLWFQAGKFGGKAKSGEGEVRQIPAELRSLATYAAGLYLVATGIPDLSFHVVDYMRYSGRPDHEVITFLTPATMLITGTLLILISTKPSWLTSMFSWVKSSYAYDDEPEATEPPLRH